LPPDPITVGNRSPELIAPLGPLMARRVAAGHGHEDLDGVVELLKEGK
jgi:hypothetical protein